MESENPQPEGDTTHTNALEITVSELSFAIKRSIEDQFGHVRLRGEVGRVSRPASGHIYLDLKDDRSVISGVIWKGVSSRLAHQPEEGLEVIATGKLTTFPGQSKYQIVIENIEPAGAGALMAQLEARKKKLAAEGLFDEARKQLLPYLPSVIGVVTSPTGSVIRDVLHRLAARFPLHVLVWPVRVQGESCANEVATAIKGFNALPVGGEIPKPDLLIVARGGGSIEDLWGFNEEIVAREAANSDIPLISAIGHETDWTLIDLAADVRAPTPTGAAEIAVQVKSELVTRVASLETRLSQGMSRKLDDARGNLLAAERGLATPEAMLQIPRQRLDHATARLGQGLALSASAKRSKFERTSARLNASSLKRSIELGRERTLAIAKRSDIAITRILEKQADSVQQGARMLQSLSYERALERGFAVVRNADGKMITMGKGLGLGDAVSIRFKDGDIGAQITNGETKLGRFDKPKVSPKKTTKSDKPDQGSLF